MPELKKLKRFNWYGFDHAKVNKHFTGGLTYCGTFTVNGERCPVAVYHVAQPDRAKGHKDFLLLQATTQGGLVRGMDKDQIEPFRKQQGIQCDNCGDVIYSVMVHDMRYCECKQSFVDGGRDYLRTSATATPVSIDLIRGTYAESSRGQSGRISDSKPARKARVSRRAPGAKRTRSRVVRGRPKARR